MRLVWIKTKVEARFVNVHQITSIIDMVNLHAGTPGETKVMMSDGNHFFVDGSASEFATKYNLRDKGDTKFIG